jgi:protein involved in polysaccharide export with SLBB domain
MKTAVFGYTIVLLALAVSPLVEGAQAQSIGRVEETESNAPDYYYHVQTGSRTIQVHVFGAVRNSGLYEVNQGTSLAELLALSGGPQLDVRERRTRRKISVKLFRPTNGSNAPIYESELDDASLYTDSSTILQESDVVRVEVVNRSLFSWRDALQIVATAATVFLVLDQTNRN